MNEYKEDNKKKIAGMSRKEKISYVFTYYWYYFLGIAAVFLLIFIFGHHLLFGEKQPLFSCVAVNRVTDDERDDALAEDFAEWSGIEEDRISIDSNYNFSYEGVRLQGVNESFYDKFFIKWGNCELDAVIMDEDFYRYCKKMNGRFFDLDGFDTGMLTLYEDDGMKTAVVLKEDLFPALQPEGDKKLLLAFPDNGKHEEECRKFIKYIEDAFGD